VNELKKYNPELLHKKRLLAITKCDMLDEVMMDQMKPMLPNGIPSIFLSSVTGMNVDRLKDMIWEQINQG
jgi:GTP-binding protein